MIARCDTFCPGCNAKIRPRVSLGVDDKQPLFFVCAKCGAVTRGLVTVEQKRGSKGTIGAPAAKLTIEGGKLCRKPHDTPDQTVTLSSDFPAVASAAEMWDEGGSPFLMQRSLMGEEHFSEFLKRAGTIRNVVATDKVHFQRLATYYLDRNWRMFDEEGSRIFEEAWPDPKSVFQRHDMFHKIVDVLFMPLMPDRLYPDLKSVFD